MPKVLVVGAGAAGLRVAKLLLDNSIEVEILEASERVGGRVWSITEFADFPVEAGACFIHGELSLLAHSAQAQNIPFSEVEGSFQYIFQGKLKNHKSLLQDPCFKDFLEFREAYHYYEAEESISSVADFLRKHHVPNAYWPFYAALVGAYGASLKDVDMSNMALSSQNWPDGAKNFRLKRPFSELLAPDFTAVQASLRYKKVVRLVEQHESGVRLITEQGEIFEAEAAVVTVSLALLQQNFIQFVPPLSENKQTAITTLKMGKGRKIFLKFKQKFWPPSLAEITGGSVAQEYWVEGKGKNSQQAVLTAFILDRPEPEELLVSLLLAELASAFGLDLETQLKPLFEKSLDVNWGGSPYIQGLYSYPSVQAHRYRRALALPSGRRIFWAGEATDRFLFGTVQGAWASAERAASEILESLR